MSLPQIVPISPYYKLPVVVAPRYFIPIHFMPYLVLFFNNHLQDPASASVVIFEVINEILTGGDIPEGKFQQKVVLGTVGMSFTLTLL